jgi:hypothetical protein
MSLSACVCVGVGQNIMLSLSKKKGRFLLLLTDYTRLKFDSNNIISSSYQNISKINPKKYSYKSIFLDDIAAAIATYMKSNDWLSSMQKKTREGHGEKGEGESCMCARTHIQQRETLLQLNSVYLCAQNVNVTCVLYLAVALKSTCAW